VLAILVFSGCTTALKDRWVDFNAYFNTYYNAKESFKRGTRLIDNQVVTFNPARPIRVHLTPVRAGQAEFEKTIEKSANVLREHGQSKWADDALELIGKSYFFLGQYFSAEQKFNEVLMASPNDDVRQRAVLWKGRIYLETNRAEEGVDYLNARIISQQFDWDEQVLGEIDLILAQLFVELKNFEQAEDKLRSGIPKVGDRNLTARARFLHGQVLNLLGRHEEAFKAFSSVDRSYRDYQLIYLAEVEKGRIYRLLGQYDRAIRHFTAMSRDDKHFEEIGDLNYEIARTLQERGDADDAYDGYLDVLYESLRPPKRVTVAMAHYGLAELNRYEFGDYALAAAHYDSSARAVTDPLLLPVEFDALPLSKAFGDHTRLSRESFKLDSLLTLALKPRAERDSLIAALRESRYNAYEARQRELLRQGTTLVTTRPGGVNDPNQPQGNSGFLNHKNPALVIQGSESFAAVWQKRPLVDNWRRMEVARNARVETQDVGGVVRTGSAVVRSRTDLDGVLNIQLNELPLTPERQTETRARIAALEYEIGNVFYLTLNMPDSALAHYSTVVNRFPDAQVSAQAMYSIADVALSEADTITALRYADLLKDQHAGSIYDTRLARRVGRMSAMGEESGVAKDSLSVVFDTLIADVAALSPVARGEALRAFATRNRDFPRSGDVLYTSAVSYAEGGGLDSTKVILNHFIATYPQHPNVAKARILITDLTAAPAEESDMRLVECSTLDQPLTVRGGMDAFIANSGLKALMERVGVVEADFEFEVIVSEEGALLNIEAITEEDEYGFILLLKDRMNSGLSYFPPVSGGVPVRSRCDIAISVRP
jgi:tetratricopeptide (TPR) repeat protein